MTTKLTPRHFRIGRIDVADIRDFWPLEGSAARPAPLDNMIGIALHHDAILMPAGDLDYSGSSLDEDLERIDIIHRHALASDWGHFPYHMVATPNGRLFYTVDLDRYGAHIARRNHELKGICILGNYMTGQPTPAALCAAGAAVTAILQARGGIFPIRPHLEWALPGYGTLCPGDTWPAYFDKIWQAVAYHARR